MTLVERDVAGVRGADRQPSGAFRRIWGLPLWAHVAALAAVLLALVPLVGAGSSFSADEGAAIIQAKSLADGHGWTVAHPLPQVDPSNRWYPLELSEGGSKGVAPFGKHPLYALVLAGADKVGGVTAMVLLSLLGTVVAAAAAAAIARRLSPGLSRPTLWAVGLASPLLFDGYLVIAHTLGAALAALAVLLAIIAVERRSALIGAAVAPVLLAAVLLRTEAALFALALGAVAAVVAFVERRRGPLPALVIGAGSLGAAVGGRLLERVWTRQITGMPVSVGTARGAVFGFVDGRVNAITETLLKPSADARPGVTVALLLMVAAIAVGAFVARRRPDDRTGMRFAAVLAGTGAVFALVADRHNLVSGLLVAFPVGLAGVFCLTRRTVEQPVARILAGVFGLFALAVVATQYAEGGTAEWGGRYFALGLPVAVPVLLLALARLGPRIGPAAAKSAVVALVMCSVSLSTMGLLSLRSTHRITADILASIDRSGRAQPPEADGGAPVMISTLGLFPRLAWATWDRQRWLLVPPADLAQAMSALRAAGITSATLVSHDEAHDRTVLGPGVAVTTAAPGAPWTVLNLSLK